MQSPALDAARSRGMIPAVMTTDMRQLIDKRPSLIVDDIAMAAALRGLGYTAGEVDARLGMSGRAS
ncbi:hypothetical protein SAMN02745157_0665 [Kaistia soli DSM 19436]|uniref:Uncharacterized protein n=1 Tax=Kaistia soli DSM 19436 TaxID=1122133 RepID=A0A1M4VC47_9HYPH|nr:hypothetical protein [Kaistia soli]SHE66506.1 hypothetical protein SAMN02745157_0665 [Kaistia soli DSM 19436]